MAQMMHRATWQDHTTLMLKTLKCSRSSSDNNVFYRLVFFKLSESLALLCVFNVAPVRYSSQKASTKFQNHYDKTESSGWQSRLTGMMRDDARPYKDTL